MHDDPITTRGVRFRLRTVLTCIAFIAFIIGWYASIERERTKSDWLSQQLSNSRLQVGLAESRAELQSEVRVNVNEKGQGVLSRARLEGESLRGAVIQGDSSAFQQTIFDSSDLSSASLTGGVASFQGASFNNAILKNAKLTGGGSSFQLATFEGADLSGAVLIGNLQGVSLRNARCVGITIKGSFQGANLDAAQFQQGDLSAIESVNLASCYFSAPPTYDADTLFPDNFNPTAHGWKEIPRSRKD